MITVPEDDAAGDPDLVADGTELIVNELAGRVLRSTRTCTP